jgi:hypothetical protein
MITRRANTGVKCYPNQIAHLPPPPPPKLQAALPHLEWQHYPHHLEESSSLVKFPLPIVERKGKNRMVEELFPKHICKIGLTTTWPEERMVQLSIWACTSSNHSSGHNQSGRPGCGHSPSHLNILKRYTVKKGKRFSHLQPGCHLPNFLWQGLI